MAQRLLSFPLLRTPRVRRWATVASLLLVLPASASLAGPLLAPGDLRLRHDLELLNDSGVIDVPLTAWPLSVRDIRNALAETDAQGLDDGQKWALDRLRGATEGLAGPQASVRLSGAVEPRAIRGFEYTPRAEGEAEAALEWAGERVFGRLGLTLAADPFDGETLRLDGTYAGVHIGNWMLTAGWQERWYGPGNDSSLLLSTNARPTPGIMLQRNLSTPFASRWLAWLGPWTLTTFMSLLDDEREIDDALLFGLRGSFRPLPGLEIGLSRAAQWCGSGRPCDLATFADLLVGNDNRGVNVSLDDEPGNQLGGVDVRWVLPRAIPAAVYLQWVGEDGREGPSPLGSWLRQAGVEAWGSTGRYQHRTHFEVADTLCREGGLGFSDEKPDCAYGHSIYRTGYRYRGRAIGHAVDSDGLAYSMGTTWIRRDGTTWNVSLRHIELNRAGSEFDGHSLTATPRELTDVLLTHSREIPIGRIRAGIGYRRMSGSISGGDDSDVEAFVSWSSR